MTNFRLLEAELKKKLDEGKVTRDDMKSAMATARALGTDHARVMYVRIKRQVEAQELMQQEESADKEE